VEQSVHECEYGELPSFQAWWCGLQIEVISSTRRGHKKAKEGVGETRAVEQSVHECRHGRQGELSSLQDW
jgi:hypothetical protein